MKKTIKNTLIATTTIVAIAVPTTLVFTLKDNNKGISQSEEIRNIKNIIQNESNGKLLLKNGQLMFYKQSDKFWNEIGEENFALNKDSQLSETYTLKVSKEDINLPKLEAGTYTKKLTLKNFKLENKNTKNTVLASDIFTGSNSNFEVFGTQIQEINFPQDEVKSFFEKEPYIDSLFIFNGKSEDYAYRTPDSFMEGVWNSNTISINQEALNYFGLTLAEKDDTLISSLKNNYQISPEGIIQFNQIDAHFSNTDEAIKINASFGDNSSFSFNNYYENIALRIAPNFNETAQLEDFFDNSNGELTAIFEKYNANLLTSERFIHEINDIGNISKFFKKTLDIKYLKAPQLTDTDEKKQKIEQAMENYQFIVDSNEPIVAKANGITLNFSLVKVKNQQSKSKITKVVKKFTRQIDAGSKFVPIDISDPENFRIIAHNIVIEPSINIKNKTIYYFTNENVFSQEKAGDFIIRLKHDSELNQNQQPISPILRKLFSQALSANRYNFSITDQIPSASGSSLTYSLTVADTQSDTALEEKVNNIQLNGFQKFEDYKTSKLEFFFSENNNKLGSSKPFIVKDAVSNLSVDEASKKNIDELFDLTGANRWKSIEEQVNQLNQLNQQKNQSNLIIDLASPTNNISISHVDLSQYPITSEQRANGYLQLRIRINSSFDSSNNPKYMIINQYGFKGTKTNQIKEVLAAKDSNLIQVKWNKSKPSNENSSYIILASKEFDTKHPNVGVRISEKEKPIVSNDTAIISLEFFHKQDPSIVETKKIHVVLNESGSNNSSDSEAAIQFIQQYKPVLQKNIRGKYIASKIKLEYFIDPLKQYANLLNTGFSVQYQKISGVDLIRGKISIDAQLMQDGQAIGSVFRISDIDGSDSKDTTSNNQTPSILKIQEYLYNLNSKIEIVFTPSADNLFFASDLAKNLEAISFRFKDPETESTTPFNNEEIKISELKIISPNDDNGSVSFKYRLSYFFKNEEFVSNQESFDGLLNNTASQLLFLTNKTYLSEFFSNSKIDLTSIISTFDGRSISEFTPDYFNGIKLEELTSRTFGILLPDNIVGDLPFQTKNDVTISVYKISPPTVDDLQQGILKVQFLAQRGESEAISEAISTKGYLTFDQSSEIIKNQITQLKTFYVEVSDSSNPLSLKEFRPTWIQDNVNKIGFYSDQQSSKWIREQSSNNENQWKYKDYNLSVSIKLGDFKEFDDSTGKASLEFHIFKYVDGKLMEDFNFKSYTFTGLKTSFQYFKEQSNLYIAPKLQDKQLSWDSSLGTLRPEQLLIDKPDAGANYKLKQFIVNQIDNEEIKSRFRIYAGTVSKDILDIDFVSFTNGPNENSKTMTFNITLKSNEAAAAQIVLENVNLTVLDLNYNKPSPQQIKEAGDEIQKETEITNIQLPSAIANSSEIQSIINNKQTEIQKINKHFSLVRSTNTSSNKGLVPNDEQGTLTIEVTLLFRNGVMENEQTNFKITIINLKTNKKVAQENAKEIYKAIITADQSNLLNVTNEYKDKPPSYANNIDDFNSGKVVDIPYTANITMGTFKIDFSFVSNADLSSTTLPVKIRLYQEENNIKTYYSPKEVQLENHLNDEYLQVTLQGFAAGTASQADIDKAKALFNNEYIWTEAEFSGITNQILSETLIQKIIKKFKELNKDLVLPKGFSWEVKPSATILEPNGINNIDGSIKLEIIFSYYNTPINNTNLTTTIKGFLSLRDKSVEVYQKLTTEFDLSSNFTADQIKEGLLLKPDEFIARLYKETDIFSPFKPKLRKSQESDFIVISADKTSLSFQLILSYEKIEFEIPSATNSEGLKITLKNLLKPQPTETEISGYYEQFKNLSLKTSTLFKDITLENIKEKVNFPDLNTTSGRNDLSFIVTNITASTTDPTQFSVDIQIQINNLNKFTDLGSKQTITISGLGSSSADIDTQATEIFALFTDAVSLNTHISNKDFQISDISTAYSPYETIMQKINEYGFEAPVFEIQPRNVDKEISFKVSLTKNGIIKTKETPVKITGLATSFPDNFASFQTEMDKVPNQLNLNDPTKYIFEISAQNINDLIDTASITLSANYAVTFELLSDINQTPIDQGSLSLRANLKYNNVLVLTKEILVVGIKSITDYANDLEKQISEIKLTAKPDTIYLNVRDTTFAGLTDYSEKIAPLLKNNFSLSVDQKNNPPKISQTSDGKVSISYNFNLKYTTSDNEIIIKTISIKADGFIKQNTSSEQPQ